MLHVKPFNYKRREEKGAFVFTTCCPLTFAENVFTVSRIARIVRQEKGSK